MWQPPARLPEKPKKQSCTRCRAAGRVPCEICGGRGETIAGRDAKGYPTYTRCNGCFGNRSMRCRNCSGEGFV